MKKKLRITAILAAAAVCTALISGCHGSRKKEVFEIPEDFDEGSKYEITFWAKNDTNITQTKIYEKAIEDFETLYPNINVVLRPYTDYGKIYNDVITNIPTDTTPNVCITYPDHIATYLTGENTVVPLDSLFDNEKYGFGGSALKYDSPTRGEMIPEYLDECILNGYHYAIPYMRSTEACYINKTYVEKLGYTIPDILTWDYIWEVSDKAAEKDADGTYKLNGQKVMIPFIYKSTDNMMIQLLKQSGGGYSDSSGGIYIFNETTKEHLYTIAEHVGTGAFSTFKISSYPGNFLNAGQCIFAIDSTAGATWLGTHAPLSDISDDKKVEFETVVRPVPQFDVNDPKMISQGPSVCIFNKKNEQEVLASWLFAQFLLTNGVQTAYAQTEGYVPVTFKARSDSDYLDYLSKGGTDYNEHYSVKIDATKLLSENTQNTFITPVFNGSASLRDAAGQLIESVAKSVRRRETVDDSYMETLFKNTEALYRLDQISAMQGADNRKELGDLPAEAIILLSSLAAAWVMIVIYVFLAKAKEKAREQAREDAENAALEEQRRKLREKVLEQLPEDDLYKKE